MSGTRTEAACLAASMAMQRATPYKPANAFTVLAWTEGGTPIDVSAAADVKEAADIAANRVGHKGGFVLLQTHDGTNRQACRFCRVKRSTKHHTYRPALDGGNPVREGKLEAVEVFAMAVTAFAPVEPWKWTPGCDVVGIDRTLIEARP